MVVKLVTDVNLYYDCAIVSTIDRNDIKDKVVRVF